MVHVYIANLCRMCFFFFNDTATTEIYTLSLHDALPISGQCARVQPDDRRPDPRLRREHQRPGQQHRRLPRRLAHLDRKSTRLNSSHANISYAVFCLKKTKRNLLKPSLISTLTQDV